jgi:hypothetical protein
MSNAVENPMGTISREQIADKLTHVEQLIKTHSLELAFFKDLFHDRMVTMDAIAIELEKLRERLA